MRYCVLLQGTWYKFGGLQTGRDFVCYKFLAGEYTGKLSHRQKLFTVSLLDKIVSLSYHFLKGVPENSIFSKDQTLLFSKLDGKIKS